MSDELRWDERNRLIEELKKWLNNNVKRDYQVQILHQTIIEIRSERLKDFVAS